MARIESPLPEDMATLEGFQRGLVKAAFPVRKLTENPVFCKIRELF
jgi:hypothetical protein